MTVRSSATLLVCATALLMGESPVRKRSDPEPVRSSWDDLLDGVKTADDWGRHRTVLRQRYLDLIRDQHKPARPSLDLKIHETAVVDGIYRRQLISYNVEQDERAHAYLAVPLKIEGKAPAVVALHETFAKGKEQASGLAGDPDKAHLDHLARRGYVVLAPDHFVAGHRTPPEGPYETARFYDKHPNWTAVGKFTYEHSIAIDVLRTLKFVDSANIGAVGHSLGGHGTFFLAAYDERIKAAAANCSATTLRQNARVEAWSRDRWYVYLKHVRPGLLRGELPPIDYHEIIALIAPRAYLELNGLNDGDPAAQRQRVLMLMKVMDVYDLLKTPQNFAFFTHGRGHSVAYESRELMSAWLDAHLKDQSVTRSQRVSR